MLRFKYFYDDWLEVTNFANEESDLHVRLTANFLDSLKFDTDSLKMYRVDAAKNLMPMLGDKPALCMSGGIDSQATWQCFNEANIDIDVYTLVFKNGLNKQDVDHAILFADHHDIKLNFIEIDIINFLSRENAEYGKKYKSQSPHFNTHYKLCDILSTKGYTGFVCGGATPMISDKMSMWVSNYNQNFLNYINYSEISGKLCQGNFLGFYPHLTWATTLLIGIFKDEVYGQPLSQEMRDKLEYKRYLSKTEGYRQMGFDIIPQDKKYTGFELVKNHLEEIYSDGWAFEKLYRFPLQQISKVIDVNIHLDKAFADKVLSYSK